MQATGTEGAKDAGQHTSCVTSSCAVPGAPKLWLPAVVAPGCTRGLAPGAIGSRVSCAPPGSLSSIASSPQLVQLPTAQGGGGGAGE